MLLQKAAFAAFFIYKILYEYLLIISFLDW